MITDVPGLRAGHWTDATAATGCTVVLFPEGTVASGEVRGGAPASRETALLDPTRTVDRIDALVLTGGSAFGLAAADGAMRFCEERGMGFPTPAGPVPIVVALGLFDLAVGDLSVRPGPDQGYAACVAATAGPVEVGRVGAGTGATVAVRPTLPAPVAAPVAGPTAASVADPVAGPTAAAVADPVVASGPTEGAAAPGPAARPFRRPGGLVSASARVGDLVVAALVAVNAAGAPGADDSAAADVAAGGAPAPDDIAGSGVALANTTIGLVATNATLDKVGCHLLAQSAHDGLARAVFPVHTRADGDGFVAAAVGGVEAPLDAVRDLGVHVVARAIRTLAGRGPAGQGR